MPDPLLWSEAFALAGFVSAVLTLLAWRLARPEGADRAESRGLDQVVVLAVGAGFAAGCWLLRLPTAWIPVNALDRFLVIVFPATVAVELIAASPSVSRRLTWLLRIGLSAAVGRILLHGSVYLGGPLQAWNEAEAAAVLAGAAMTLTAVWWLVSALGRHAGPAVPYSLAMSLLGSGLVVMLEGYLKGGIAPIPLAAAILGGMIAAGRVSRSSDGRAVNEACVSQRIFVFDGVLGIGVVGLFGTLFIARFFAGLPTGSALALLSAPLWAWIAELLPIALRSGRRGVAVRLLLAAIPIAVVLLLATPEFVKETLPLLTSAETPLRWPGSARSNHG